VHSCRFATPPPTPHPPPVLFCSFPTLYRRDTTLLQVAALVKVLRSARVVVLDVAEPLIKEHITPSGCAPYTLHTRIWLFMSTGLSEAGNHIWIVLEGMLQVARTAKRFATAQQQLVQRVARKKGKARGETKRSKTNWISRFFSVRYYVMCDGALCGIPYAAIACDGHDTHHAACMDPAPLPEDVAHVFHAGITVTSTSLPPPL
jgi:hypothetical protein